MSSNSSNSLQFVELIYSPWENIYSGKCFQQQKQMKKAGKPSS